MGESFVSVEEIWSRLADLSPKLRKHIKIHVHVYRNERWYLLQDELSGEHVRLNSRAYGLVGRLDGKCTLSTIYHYLIANESPDLSITEVVNLIGRMQRMGIISNVMDKSTTELVEQYRDKRRTMRFHKLISPLLIRIPLFNPDALLNKITPYFKNVLSTLGALIWLMVVLPAAVLVFQHWDALASAYRTDILKPNNILLLFILYPLMKLLHEFAHAICVKRWGGDVHEMGITLMVLAPIPYVDASAATAFKSKHKRMMVSAAGILVEVFLAAIAFYFWVGASDGLLRDCAFGVFTIGAVSTVLFNANPLLKFDGYFLLQDAIEIPNLMARSTHYYRYLFKHYVLKLEGEVSPVTAHGERRWFIAYGLLSTLYRIFILFFIVIFLSSRYLLIGVALGGWAVIQQLILPLVKSINFVLRSPETAHQRSRSTRVVVGGLVATAVIIGVVPLPSSTRAQGVVWVPQQGEIFAETAGFVSEVAVSPGEQVSKGQLLLTLVAPELEKSIVVMENELLAMDVRSELLRSLDPSEYSMLQEDIAAQKRVLAEKRQQRDHLEVVAQADGTFTPTQLQKLAGRYFAQGELIAQIVDPSALVVRVAVPDVNSGRLQTGVKSASVKLAESLGQNIKASVVNEVPAADRTLPSPALGAAGGGGIAIASNDPKGLTTVQSIFHLQLGLPENTKIFGVGERAYVTLRHKAEPLGKRWLRSLRQVFLKTLPA